jgi:hypothetical protein
MSSVIEDVPHLPPDTEIIEAAITTGIGDTVRGGYNGPFKPMLLDQMLSNLVRIVVHRFRRLQSHGIANSPRHSPALRPLPLNTINSPLDAAIGQRQLNGALVIPRECNTRYPLGRLIAGQERDWCHHGES